MARSALGSLLFLIALPPTPLDAEDRLDVYGDAIPAGADVRLGTVRFRHGYDVAGLAFLDRGETLISVGEGDGHACVWDVRTGRRKRRWNLDVKNVRDFQLSPDSKQFGVLSFYFDEKENQYVRTIQFFNSQSGKRENTISWVEPRGSEAFVFRYIPDGTSLISGSRDGTLRVWDRKQGQELLSHKLSDREINGLSVSPNWDQIAVATRKAVYLWNWLDGNPPRKLDTGLERPRDCAFSPDGRRLSISGGTSEGVRFWDLEKGKMLSPVEPAVRSYVRRVKFFPDGKRLAASDYDRRGVVIYDVKTQKHVRVLEMGTESPDALAISPDGQMLAATGSHGMIHVWNLETGKDYAAQYEAHFSGANDLAFAERDGRRLAVTSSDDGTVRVWDAATGKQLQLLRHDGWVRAADISPDGRYVVSSSFDETVRLWETETGKEIYRLPGHGKSGGHRTVAFTKDGRRFASWGDDWNLRVWDVRTGKAISEELIKPSDLAMPQPQGDDPSSGRFDDPFQFHVDALKLHGGEGPLAISMGLKTYLFDVPSGKEIGIIESEEYGAYSLAISPDRKTLLSIGTGRGTQTQLKNGGVRYSSAKNHAVLLRELPGGKVLWKHVLPEGGSGAVAFSPDGKYMAASLRPPYNEIRIWDTRTKELLREIKDVPHISYYRSLTFSPDGNRLGCGLGDATVLIWDWKELQSAKGSKTEPQGK